MVFANYLIEGWSSLRRLVFPWIKDETMKRMKVCAVRDLHTDQRDESTPSQSSKVRGQLNEISNARIHILKRVDQDQGPHGHPLYDTLAWNSTRNGGVSKKNEALSETGRSYEERIREIWILELSLMSWEMKNNMRFLLMNVVMTALILI